CEYGIGWLPLGGYVKIAGMIDESMDTEQMKGEPQPWEFRSKPAWQRLIVMLGGIIVNVILGIFIFWMLTFRYGETYIDNDRLVNGIVPGVIGKDIGLQAGDRIVKVDGERVVRFSDVLSSKVLMGGVTLTVERDGAYKDVRVPKDILNKIADYSRNEFVTERVLAMSIAQIEPGTAAEEAGLLPGDSITHIAGTPIRFWDEMRETLTSHAGQDVSLVVIRDGKERVLTAHVPEAGVLGFLIHRDPTIPYETMRYGLLESLPIGAAKAWATVADNAKGLGK